MGSMRGTTWQELPEASAGLDAWKQLQQVEEPQHWIAGVGAEDFENDRQALRSHGVELEADHMDGYQWKPPPADVDRSALIKPWEVPLEKQLQSTDPPPVMCDSPETWNNPEVLFEIKGKVAYVTLNRPAANNAMNDGISAGIHDAILILKRRTDVRLVVLSGQGRMFCAGGDPKSFQAHQSQGSKGESVPKANPDGPAIVAAARSSNEDAADLFAWDMYSWSVLPQFTLACANGSAMGGGVGLLCVCDMAVVVKTAMAALSEVKLGVIPAVISPHVIRTIGRANAARLFCTAENITSQQMLEMGLAQRIVADASEFPAVIEEVSQALQSCSPEAVAACKRVMLNTFNQPVNVGLAEYTAQATADCRKSADYAEGVRALREDRAPLWASEPPEAVST